ncbi:MAG: TetR/AcrR family transcriptional regulator [Kiritimatiellaeota bacterium]|nr:TetR/AcrR family transcriptional regulator [Kiritimatiellota bacterium]
MNLTERQSEIVETALGLIADHGIQKLTIKNIAEGIGVTEPAIYRHFEGKSSILSSILDSFEEISECVLDSEDVLKTSALDAVGNFLFDRYERFSNDPKLAKVMFSEELFIGDAELSARMLKIMHSHKERMHKVIERGQENGDIRGDVDSLSIFRTIFGAMRLLVKQWCLSGCAFDLKEEGKKLWNGQIRLLKSCCEDRRP